MWHQQSYSLRTFPLNDTAPRKVPPVTERQKFTKPKYWSFSEKDLDKSAGVLSSLSRVWLCATLWAVVHQAPLSIGFSRQEYWSGLPCPSPGELPNPGIKPLSPNCLALAGDSITSRFFFFFFLSIMSPWKPLTQSGKCKRIRIRMRRRRGNRKYN